MAYPRQRIVDGKKTCNECGEWKPLDQFYKHKRTSSGRSGKCKVCMGHTGRPGRPKVNVVEGKKPCSRCKEWKPTSEFSPSTIHSTGLSSRCKPCNVERLNEQCSRSISRFLNSLRSIACRRDMDRRQLSLDYLLSLWEAQSGRCAITGLPMTHVRGHGRQLRNASIDRIDSAKGYIPGNVRLVCWKANQIKGEESDSELLEWCNLITSGIAPKEQPCLS